jgi:pre-mRNA cleavage complex 2 protein Pcf11
VRPLSAASTVTQNYAGINQATSDLERVKSDVERLITATRAEFNRTPNDPDIPKKIKLLIDLQTILNTGQPAPSDIRKISDQVAQLGPTAPDNTPYQNVIFAHRPSESTPVQHLSYANHQAFPTVPIPLPSTSSSGPQIPSTQTVQASAPVNSFNLSDLLRQTTPLTTPSTSSTVTVPVISTHPQEFSLANLLKQISQPSNATPLPINNTQNQPLPTTIANNFDAVSALKNASWWQQGPQPAKSFQTPDSSVTGFEAMSGSKSSVTENDVQLTTASITKQ